MRKKGKVIKFSTESGNGTIRYDDGSSDFNISQVIGKDLPSYGDEVEFEYSDDKCSNILVLKESSNSSGSVNVNVVQQQVLPINQGPRDTWGGVILWIVLFWPYGVFKLIRKLTS